MRKNWQKEREEYSRRTPKSEALWLKAKKVLPMGTASNARWYNPYPMFIQAARGSRVIDVDGNEYIDHNMSFGALLTGHRHPTVMAAVENQLALGTMYGMCHELEAQVAEEIIKRYPFVDKLRFASTGTEATMHAIRLARACTSRDVIVKMEGAYHGLHDSVMVSVKPSAEEWGPYDSPTDVLFGRGVSIGTTLVAQFNDIRSLELCFSVRGVDHPAALIMEPVMMNMGVLVPKDGYLQEVRNLCTKYGVLLIFDEVKSAGMGYGGASEYYGVTPDIVCLSKSIGGGFPLAAFGASEEIMQVIEEHKMFHAGTYNANPIAMAAGLATLRDVLTKESYDKARELNKRLTTGYKNILEVNEIKGLVTSIGVNGAVVFGVDSVSNYRDWSRIDTDMWEHYWFGMVNRGIIPQPYWWDEEWTVSVAHTEADIDAHLVALLEVTQELKKKMGVGND